MSDSRVYAPINQCDLVGYEKASNLFINYGIISTADNYGNARFFMPNVIGMIIDQSDTIAHLYTNPLYRRQGYAKQLLAAVRHSGIKVYHSDNCTNDGMAFKQSVK
jgi:GNAT superfamily N-acetyltransferase